jgi:hypothetical protein
MLLTGTYPVYKAPLKPRKPKHIIPHELRAVYADAHAQAVKLRRQGKTHMEVCEELNRLGYRACPTPAGVCRCVGYAEQEEGEGVNPGLWQIMGVCTNLTLK